MAKEDFCFTYYDGDAARDTTHMNRLERGAYHDLVISQRKFGHLSLDQVKKILGRDFAECWPAIELIMKVDTEGKFFIEWLDTSIKKMRAQAKHQSENGKKGGRPKTKQNPTKTQIIPNQKPLGDGDGNGDEDGKEIDLEVALNNASRETETLPGEMVWGDEIYRPSLYRLAETYNVPDVRNLLDRWEGWYVNKFQWRDKTLQEMRLSFEGWIKDPKSRVSHGKAKHDRSQQNLNDIAIILQHAGGGGNPGN